MKIEHPGSHAEHLLRQTRMHHIQLSSMADAKANILLTTSLVVVTLSVRYVSDPLLKWPTLSLIAFCLLTVALATYVVMPHLPVRLPKAQKRDKHGASFNLLFFGDFLSMSYADYEREMEAVLSDPARSYEVQVREVYLLGEYLARKKYRFLRLAYSTLILGIVTSVGIALWERFAL